MQILEQLGMALGLAAMAGINLYLTVLVVGVAVRMDWLQLAAEHQEMATLAHPGVLAVAGLLFCLEFVADKVPWLDSLWDAVHTLVRPVGGVLLALQALGEVPAWLEVTGALLAGGTALSLHGMKAGTRLMINQSPEPVSNAVVSVAEDVGVFGFSLLTLTQPLVALGLTLALLAGVWLVFPGLVRRLMLHLSLVTGRLRRWMGRVAAAPVGLPREVQQWAAKARLGAQTGLRGLRVGARIWLLGQEQPAALVAVSRGMWGDRVVQLPLWGLRVMRLSRMWSEDVILQGENYGLTLRFPVDQQAAAEELRERLLRPETAAVAETREASAHGVEV